MNIPYKYPFVHNKPSRWELIFLFDDSLNCDSNNLPKDKHIVTGDEELKS